MNGACTDMENTYLSMKPAVAMLVGKLRMLNESMDGTTTEQTVAATCWTISKFIRDNPQLDCPWMLNAIRESCDKVGGY